MTALDWHQTVILLMGDATNAFKIAIAGIPTNQNVTMECASKVWPLLTLHNWSVFGTWLIYPDKMLFKIAEEIVTVPGQHQTVILLIGGAINAYKSAIVGIPSNQNVTMECALKVWLISNLVAPFSHLPCILDFFYICRRFLWWFFQRWRIINL